MRLGSQEVMSPSASIWVVIVARSVSGLLGVGVMESNPSLARTACNCSFVARISAYVLFFAACDGRYLIFVGASLGWLVQVVVRHSAQVSVFASVVTIASLGE